MFHVEPTFGVHWARYNRALKQRNAALRSGAARVAAWDAELDPKWRWRSPKPGSATLERLVPCLEQTFERFGGLGRHRRLHDRAGWRARRSRRRCERTRSGIEPGARRPPGPHRADVTLRRNHRVARETLSRGQQKLTAVAMIVSQLRLLQDELDLRAVLLLDDPAAELDEKICRCDESAATCSTNWSRLRCQMIATSLTPETALFQAPKATFHVEQGRVNRL